MEYTKVTIKETRNNLAELIEKVALTKESFLVTKFGKPKALIVSVDLLDKKNDAKIAILRKTSGLWAGRKEMKNSSFWVSKLRKKQSSRYGKVFG